ncbi:MAG: [formate-C-acetyltransferase]-activating enzyme [Hafnia sp.]|uniref:Pyruvate formate-lyase activating enzyme n=1 Tax=Obesumbacterium proteus ATCC 12841 TaxID=1354268 RepID=A0AA91EDS0_9GAMM|nr:[formate-C-acetyltransferase]-activating enzyme [Obesumbacterium proteus]OAT58770.1 pyruvate formate-lyase activating enzyme [Obesumbacterium proteus ATCC 12841]
MTSFTVQHISSNQPISAGRLPSNVARIFNIQRYSLNDGGGIRTVVFFKGCPHICPWCANPESISNQIHIIRREAKCLHCQPCLNNADECPATAMERIGRDISLNDLLKEVLKDDVFFRSSGGGVTLSGGEVLMQAPFALQLLTQLKHLGINTAIETAGDASITTLLELAKQCDSILFDLKIMDEERAKHLLNMHQSRVLRNFTRLIEEGITLIPRVPLIPGYTLDVDNFRAILAFLAPFKLPEIHLLPFHQFGEAKYRLLNRPYKMSDVVAPSEAEIAPIRQLAINAGYRVITGG